MRIRRRQYPPTGAGPVSPRCWPHPRRSNRLFAGPSV